MDGRPSAAVLRSATSTLLNAVKPAFRMGVSPANAQVLIVDGDAFAPGSIAEDPTVASHLAAGKDVLLLDLKPEHKSNDLRAIMHANIPLASHAVLIRRTRDRFGRPEFFTSDMPVRNGEALTSADGTALRTAIARHFDRASRSRAGDFNPPDGLIYAIYNIALPPQQMPIDFTKKKSKSKKGPQWTSADIEYRYTVFLENDDTPTGDRQFVVVEANVASSPFNAAMGTTQMLEFKKGYSNLDGDVGWFQGQVALRLEPPSDGSFDFQSNSPSNTNNVTQVTTSVSANIGFMLPGSGAGGSYTYNQSTTQDISDWGVANTSTGLIGQWAWSSQNPYAFDRPEIWDQHGVGGGQTEWGEYLMPSDLSVGQLIANAMAVYVTPRIERSHKTFGSFATIYYCNAWSGLEGGKADFLPMLVVTPIELDMAAVLPIPFQDITFSQNPVNANSVNQVVGTVTLQSPAKMDTTVYLTSNSPNATVLPSVVIPQGKVSATFQVLVNTNSIPAGGQTVATIQAFHGGGFQAQLTVQNQ